MNNTIKNKIKQKNGITLIALVITIIVLLILAGVSIAMLTGQNGILTQAQNAKTTTADKSAEEKIKLAVMAARAQSEGALDADKLVAEITNNYGGTATKTGTGFPVNATVVGQSFTIDGDGNVTSTGSGNGPTERKLLSEITGNETANTPAKDNLGNPITIPAGFEVVNPNDNVEDGIVVRDKTHTKTAGSEFVWIPVGDVKTKNKGTIKIELKRYVFNEDGTVNEELTKTDPGDHVQPTGDSYYYTEGLENSQTDNTHAKNIATFKDKAEGSHGYYIGKYEARDKDATAERTTSSSTTNQLVCTADNYVYNFVKQAQAATLSRGMYAEAPFESDLMNSYAWDTATLFLQTFDNRTNKDSLKKYSIQNSLNTDSDGLASKGTNNLTEASKIDKICNVYDMASNCLEWSTETSSDSRDYRPCAQRGGLYNDSDNYTSLRYINYATYSLSYYSFRPLLYL